MAREYCCTAPFFILLGIKLKGKSHESIHSQKSIHMLSRNATDSLAMAMDM